MANKSDSRLRRIPSVSVILERHDIKPLFDNWSFPYVSFMVKKIIDDKRRLAKNTDADFSTDSIAKEVVRCFESRRADFIKPVINGTGVVLHTNLGRSPLGNEIMNKVAEVASGYCNVEFDIIGGRRSVRGNLAGEMAAVLAGAESGLIVNNCAAAIMLIVNAFASDREVVVSRGELIQIGGGFRIPEIIVASSARLREIGTTNKTTANDYKKAIGANTGLVMKVHRSNFSQTGFVSEVMASEIATIARAQKVASLYDLGSGMYSDFGKTELHVEPDIKSAVRSGVDMICFSGDKLLGGPQAGIIVGRQKCIERLARHPLYRTVRPDKICLCLIEQTLHNYLIGEDIFLEQIFRTEIEELRQRAIKICAQLAGKPVKPIALKGAAGGGSTPDVALDSFGVGIMVQIDGLEDALRKWDPPIIARNNRGKITIDLRTVFPNQDEHIINALRSCT